MERSPALPCARMRATLHAAFSGLFLCMLALLGGALLPAAARADEQMPFDVEAGNLQYDVNTGTITASEGVSISGPQGNLRAERMSYEVSTTAIIAEGNVVYTDAQSNTLYVDKLKLTGQMQQGVADRLRLAMPALGEVMQARQATKTDSTTYVLHDVVYSPCKTCVGDRKPWQLRAKDVTYDQEKQDLIYHDAKFDILGVPVVYLPYFSHPVGPRRPRNGLLPPQVGGSTRFGQQIRVGGYYFSSETNADYTVHSRLMTKRGVQLEARRRQVTETTESDISGSYLNDQDNGPNRGKIRNHLNVVAAKVFEPGERIGINSELASDDSYLNEFYGRTDPYLSSTVYGEKADENTYMGLSATRYQDLDPTRRHSETAQVYPQFDYEKMLPLQTDGSQLLLSANATNLYRSEGPRYRRLLTSGQYTKPIMLDDGSKLTLGGLIRADGYNVDGNGRNGSTGRFLPEGTLKWEKPYISPGGNHTIAPTILGAISPRGGNPDRIPNEDSVAYELDYSNLFRTSRFAGVDRIETGPRLIYGLDNRWGTADTTRWRLFVGQSFRQNTDDDLPETGGASTQFSDYVGYAEAAPVDWLAFSQNFRFDNSSLGVRRLDTSVRLGRENGVRLIAGHTYLKDGEQEFYGDFRAPINPHVEFLSRLRQDLEESRLLLGEAGVRLKHDCYEIELIARRRGYESANLEPSTDYLVNVQLLTLGDSR